MKRLSIEHFKKKASAYGGECLTDKYVSYEFKLKFKCYNNHIFKMDPRSFNSGKWCWDCHRDSIRDNLDTCKAVAKSHGGDCLSVEYQNQNKPLKWICKLGHKWNAPFGHIKNSGQWCRKCRDLKRRRSIEDCSTVGLKIGVECLSKKYKGISHKLNWRCLTCLHKWKTSFQSIKSSKRGCPCCTKEANKKGNSLDVCQEYAAKKGGFCLSKAYNDQYEKMSWQCEYGHEWQTTFKCIKQGRWCHTCAAKKRKCRGQDIVKDYLEARFKKKFKSVFPEWLVNPKTKRKMEVDGLNEKLGIGFEYQGFQHLRYNQFIHKTQENYEKIKRRDQIKKRIFKKRGLILISVKEFDTNKSKDKILEYLEKVVNKQLLRCQAKAESYQFDFKDLETHLAKERIRVAKIIKKLNLQKLTQPAKPLVERDAKFLRRPRTCKHCKVLAEYGSITLWHDDNCVYRKEKDPQAKRKEIEAQGITAKRKYYKSKK